MGLPACPIFGGKARLIWFAVIHTPDFTH